MLSVGIHQSTANKGDVATFFLPAVSLYRARRFMCVRVSVRQLRAQLYAFKLASRLCFSLSKTFVGGGRGQALKPFL